MCASSLAARCAVLAGLSLMAFGMPPAAAQTNRTDEQVRRLRQQTQQLQQDLAVQQLAAQKAEAERAALLRKLDAAEASLKATGSRLAQQARAADEVRQNADVLNQQRARAEEHVATLQAALAVERQAATALRTQLQTSELRRSTLQDTHARLLTRHAAQAEGLVTCIERNAQLRTLGLDLLQRYERKGFTDVLAAQEPVLQRGRIALEDLVQGYQDKLDAQAVQPGR